MIELSENLKNKSQEIEIRPHLILEIDGIDYIWGAYDVQRVARIGDNGLKIGQEWKIGSLINYQNSLPYISVLGSSKQLSQQLSLDDGGSGSISSISVEIIDKNNKMTEIVSDETERDLLYREAVVYLGVEGCAHPRDSICIMRGVISSILAKTGSYIFTIQHPEVFKRTTLFHPLSAKLMTTITAEADTIIIDNVNNITKTFGELFLKIDDEYIRFEKIQETVDSLYLLTGVSRGELNTIPASHNAGSDVTSAASFGGKAIELALQLMMSGADPSPKQKILAINQISFDTNIQNAILFNEDVRRKYNLSVGDEVKVYLDYMNDIDGFVFDDGIPSLHHTGRIKSFGEIEGNYYITLDSDAIITYTESLCKSVYVIFRSKYNIYEYGAGINPKYIDIEEHEKIQKIYGNSFLDYDFFLTDSIDLEDLINKQIYLPSGLYQLPRKGVISIGVTKAPIIDQSGITIDSSNILNPEKITIQRDVNNHFYNSVIYKYDYDEEDDKYYSVLVSYSEDSHRKIKIGDRPLIIESIGLKTAYSANRAAIKRCAEMFLKRYQFACEYISGVEVNFRTGLKLEIGDIVLFGDPLTKIADIKNKTRNFEPRLMEIINKTLDLKTGKVRIDLLDTSFEEGVRRGVISPSSIVKKATATTLTLKSYFQKESEDEREKWTNFIGQHIEVKSKNWARVGIAEIMGIQGSDTLLVTDLGFVPEEGDVVTVAPYSDDKKTDKLFKNIFCYINPTDKIKSVVSANSFEVWDVSNFVEGNTIIIHSDDWTKESEVLTITEVSGSTVTVKDSDILLSESLLIDLIGFSDGGRPYITQE